jgi:folate-binding protein YgfZ
MHTEQPAVTEAEPVYNASRDDANIVITLPDQRQMMIVPAATDLDKEIYQAADLPWDAADIEAGLVWIDAQTREQFLPHDVNFPGLGGVSYEKGCYTGQEIVARMHYRGNPKYTAVVVIAEEADIPFENPLKSENTEGKLKSIGQIISGPVTRGNQTLLLISAAKDITDQVQINLSNPIERAILCNVKKPNLG